MKLLFVAALALAACHHDAPQPRFVLGAAAGRLGPLAKLRFGMTARDVADAVPELQPKTHEHPDFLVWQDGTERWSAELHDGQLDVMSVETTGHRATEILAAWGTGIAVDASIGPRHRYLDAAAHIRADVEDLDKSASIEWRPYRPLAELFGTDAHFGVYGVDLLGEQGFRVTDGLAALHLDAKAKDDHQDVLHVPVTEYGDAPSITYELENGRVRRAGIMMLFDRPGALDAALAALDHKFGAHAATGHTLVEWHPADMTLDAAQTAHALGLEAYGH